MKERPILFSAPMVRAILDGRKTQTRRVVKPQPVWVADPFVPFKTQDANPKGIIRCPYGAPGDRLWVRETWRVRGKHTDRYAPSEIGLNRYHFEIAYQASIAWNQDIYGKVRPSIHMPRWASRITLEIESVRGERLNDITEDDAQAEGCYPTNRTEGTLFAGSIHKVKGTPKVFPCAKAAYRDLWESINGPGSWDINPWVWVIQFKRIEKGTK